MAEIIYSPTAAEQLRDKVVVITGGAQGIGAATVTLLHALGAHVFFGDWDAQHGTQLEADLHSEKGKGIDSHGAGTAHFTQVDVREYQSQLALFDAAHQKHGRVDVAISCAAVKEPSGWFEPESLDLATIRTEPVPITSALDINLTSVVHFARLALAYMKSDNTTPAPGSAFTKSIVLVSSIAGITPAPGLFAYAAAKHGVVGLMRALAPWTPHQFAGLRVNAICPWATATQLLPGALRDRWTAEKMPLNSPADVARFMVQCAADGEINGNAVFVSGGKGFDTEAGVERTQPLWMGEENSEQFQKGQRILGLGGDW
ncbi:hypothetical protein B0T24DRAFT_617875 [Lasiosphaeria ovina]|uniref:NAD(P)-binding protein n=1 Tax=Lasiosphaeria ovina TaxID=92902 RepID=A0AAE0KH39_9PEZI|nr:hypothetical protein B0T24DRAFT_617875 [Lasiosphaeria ovina]